MYRTIFGGSKIVSAPPHRDEIWRQKITMARPYLCGPTIRWHLSISLSLSHLKMACLDLYVYVYGGLCRYLNRADVKAAIHVDEDMKWAECSDITQVHNPLHFISRDRIYVSSVVVG